MALDESTSARVVTRSIRSGTYMKRFEALPPVNQKLIDATYVNFFRDDPHHRSLNGKTYKHDLDNRKVYRVELPGRYRALAFVEEKRDAKTNVTTRLYVWWWVGTHESYNGVVAQHLS